TPTTPPTTPPNGPCKVTFTPNTWSGGFTAELRVTNGGSALNGWSLSFGFGSGSGVRLTSGWNGEWSQNGDVFLVRNAAWNGNLPAGGTVSVGFQGTFSGASLPTAVGFTLNGSRCN
ncbi:endoglucanase, partial [Micromonospora sp. KC207]|uniref:cellulose binding domain-containing protein n=1 Tax=Micromonospora sp. KC207 TaxID=2530377 RepID=UPI0010E39F04